MNSPWKGKAKATNQDYDDLRPTITYRHLLSNNLGVRDPLRVIALCDSDAFYAACERVRLELDPSVPLVVQQWESLIAVSYPAREFGISRMDKIKDAKQKCPNLLAVHVATYKEGEKEPGYWKDVDTRTHKVFFLSYDVPNATVVNLCCCKFKRCHWIYIDVKVTRSSICLRRLFPPVKLVRCP
jgi:DNA polymerase eta